MEACVWSAVSKYIVTGFTTTSRPVEESVKVWTEFQIVKDWLPPMKRKMWHMGLASALISGTYRKSTTFDHAIS